MGTLATLAAAAAVTLAGVQPQLATIVDQLYLAFGRGDTVLVARSSDAVWRREGTVFLSTPASPEQRIGDGRDAVVALSGAHRDVAWSADAGVTLLRDGRMQVLGAGRFPSLVRRPTTASSPGNIRGRSWSSVCLGRPDRREFNHATSAMSWMAGLVLALPPPIRSMAVCPMMKHMSGMKRE